MGLGKVNLSAKILTGQQLSAGSARDLLNHFHQAIAIGDFKFRAGYLDQVFISKTLQEPADHLTC